MAKILTPLVLGLFIVTAGSASAGIVDPQVEGNVFSARIELPLGVEGELSLTFEAVSGLSEEALGLSVRAVLPTDPELRSRLPGGALAIPIAFPVVLTVAPPAGGGLSFQGLAQLRLTTGLLEYAPDTTLRLFAARPGEHFRDVTAEMSSGSYRTGGAMPDFAGEYIILSDLRALLYKVDAQLDWLDETLAAHQPGIEPSVVALLQQTLADIHSQVELGNLLQAAVEVANFLLAVESYSGEGIPDQWASWDDRANSAGDLRAVGSALSFAIGRAQEVLP